MNFTEEQMKKFNEAESVEEVLAFTKEEGIDVPEEEIRKYYFATHKGPEGELEDDELDNVAGGVYDCLDGRLVVTVNYWCDYWRHDACGGTGTLVKVHSTCGDGYHCSVCGDVNQSLGYCKNCYYCSYERGKWLCNHPSNHE